MRIVTIATNEDLENVLEEKESSTQVMGEKLASTFYLTNGKQFATQRDIESDVRGSIKINATKSDTAKKSINDKRQRKRKRQPSDHERKRWHGMSLSPKKVDLSKNNLRKL